MINKNKIMTGFAVTLLAQERLYTSESDVCRRQLLTYKEGLALKELQYL